MFRAAVSLRHCSNRSRIERKEREKGEKKGKGLHTRRPFPYQKALGSSLDLLMLELTLVKRSVVECVLYRMRPLVLTLVKMRTQSVFSLSPPSLSLSLSQSIYPCISLSRSLTCSVARLLSRALSLVHTQHGEVGQGKEALVHRWQRAGI